MALVVDAGQLLHVLLFTQFFRGAKEKILIVASYTRRNHPMSLSLQVQEKILIVPAF